jgi:hypothetical protein
LLNKFYKGLDGFATGNPKSLLGGCLAGLFHHQSAMREMEGRL